MAILPLYATHPPALVRVKPKTLAPYQLWFRRFALAAMLRGQARRDGMKKEVTES